MDATLPVFCTRCNSSSCGHLRLRAERLTARERDENRCTQLTPRDMDILRALCNPKLAGNKEIADFLGLTPATVKIYFVRVYAKMGLAPGAGRAALAVLWAMAHREELGIELPKREDFMWRLP